VDLVKVVRGVKILGFIRRTYGLDIELFFMAGYDQNGVLLVLAIFNWGKSGVGS